jgi:hypothetical protein
MLKIPTFLHSAIWKITLNHENKLKGKGKSWLESQKYYYSTFPTPPKNLIKLAPTWSIISERLRYSLYVYDIKITTVLCLCSFMYAVYL